MRWERCEHAERVVSDETGVANDGEKDVLMVVEDPGVVAVLQDVAVESVSGVAWACDHTYAVGAVGIALHSTVVPWERVPWEACVAEAFVVEGPLGEDSPWASLVVAFPLPVAVLREAVVELDSHSLAWAPGSWGSCCAC